MDLGEMAAIAGDESETAAIPGGGEAEEPARGIVEDLNAAGGGLHTGYADPGREGGRHQDRTVLQGQDLDDGALQTRSDAREPAVALEAVQAVLGDHEPAVLLLARGGEQEVPSGPGEAVLPGEVPGLPGTDGLQVCRTLKASLNQG